MSDCDIRQLERQVAQGDVDAVRSLAYARIRTGRSAVVQGGDAYWTNSKAINKGGAWEGINPFPEETQEHGDWDDGWWDADMVYREDL